MVECTDKAYAAWDKEMNKNYVELMRTLTLKGTMYIPMRIDARMEVIKKRAVELKDHLDLVQEGE